MLIPFDQLFQRRNIRPEQIHGILHLGANTGQEAEVYHRLGIRNVIWVEAIPSVFEKLKAHLTRFNGQRAYRACVGDEDMKIVTFNVANNSAQSSSILQLGTHKQKHPEVHYSSHFQTVMMRTDTLLRKVNEPIAGRWLLNADLQGAELMALKGMGDLLRHFGWLYLEVNQEPLYVGCPLLPELTEWLKARGFWMTEIQMSGNTGWGDAFFERV